MKINGIPARSWAQEQVSAMRDDDADLEVARAELVEALKQRAGFIALPSARPMPRTVVLMPQQHSKRWRCDSQPAGASWPAMMIRNPKP